MRRNQRGDLGAGRCGHTAEGYGLASGAGSDGCDVELVDLSSQESRSFGGEAAVHLTFVAKPQRGTVVLAQCKSRVGILGSRRAGPGGGDGRVCGGLRNYSGQR